MRVFRQWFDSESSTYTYLLGDGESKEAVIIDPVFGQVERDSQFIKDLGLNLKYALDTHVHADHLTALAALKERFRCRIGISENSGVEPGSADLLLKHGQTLSFGPYQIKVLATPGHTNGCVSYFQDDRVFTGDALMVRGCGRTDFQEGSAATLYDSVTQNIFTLPDSTIIYPAHDYKGHTCTTVGEEKRLNPRLTKDKNGFVEIMNNLKLSPPAKIKEAVPWNLRCGHSAK